MAGRHVAIEHDAFSSFCEGVHSQEHGDALFRVCAVNDAAKAKAWHAGDVFLCDAGLSGFGYEHGYYDDV